jgi:hypothetical protein
MKKAQSAMEYLMTYGWAILIVIIVAAALFALGVFNPSTYTQSAPTGFQGFQIPSGGFQLKGNATDPQSNLTLQLQNMVGSNINITNVTATYAGTVKYNAVASNTIAPGSAYTATVTGLPAVAPGSSYSADVVITYTNLNTGLVFSSSGKVTGTVS